MIDETLNSLDKIHHLLHEMQDELLVVYTSNHPMCQALNNFHSEVLAAKCDWERARKE